MAKQTRVQQATTKDPKKVEAGKRLAKSNCRKREEPARMAKAQSEPKLTLYGAGTVVAIGPLGFLGSCVYQFKKTSKETPVHQTNETIVN